MYSRVVIGRVRQRFGELEDHRLDAPVVRLVAERVPEAVDVLRGERDVVCVHVPLEVLAADDLQHVVRELRAGDVEHVDAALLDERRDRRPEAHRHGRAGDRAEDDAVALEHLVQSAIGGRRAGAAGRPCAPAPRRTSAATRSASGSKPL